MAFMSQNEQKPKRNPLMDYYSKLTPEERRAQGVRAGKASAEAKRKYRTQRELLSLILSSPIGDKEKAKKLKEAGFPATYGGAMALAATAKAVDGDIEAARFVRDTVGEKPTESYQMSVTDKPVKSLDLTQLTDEELEAMVASRLPDEK